MLGERARVRGPPVQINPNSYFVPTKMESTTKRESEKMLILGRAALQTQKVGVVGSHEKKTGTHEATF